MFTGKGVFGKWHENEKEEVGDSNRLSYYRQAAHKILGDF